jgi:hypothetical protein
MGNSTEISGDIKGGKTVLDRWNSGVSKKPQRGD